jgi:hypothetical protein
MPVFAGTINMTEDRSMIFPVHAAVEPQSSKNLWEIGVCAAGPVAQGVV